MPLRDSHRQCAEAARAEGEERWKTDRTEQSTTGAKEEGDVQAMRRQLSDSQVGRRPTVRTERCARTLYVQVQVGDGQGSAGALP
jgi:hypothetical protein